MSKWDDAMGVALDEARRAAIGGDVPVGAVVVGPSGEILANAGNEKERSGDVAGHAEVLAMRRAARVLGDGWRLTGCTLVVTLEPCVMCAGAIVASRIDRLVFGAFDPKAGAVASVWDLVRDPRLIHRPEVKSGIRAAECRDVLLRFFARHRPES